MSIGNNLQDDGGRGTWFTRQRQDFIRATLLAFGQIRRKDIVSRFEVTAQIASKDISDFMSSHPDAIIYDGRAKTYVLDKECISSHLHDGVTP